MNVLCYVAFNTLIILYIFIRNILSFNAISFANKSTFKHIQRLNLNQAFKFPSNYFKQCTLEQNVIVKEKTLKLTYFGLKMHGKCFLMHIIWIFISIELFLYWNQHHFIRQLFALSSSIQIKINQNDHIQWTVLLSSILKTGAYQMQTPNYLIHFSSF